ncbi:TPA: DUF1642 domain-containing protein [Streptococcus suis]|nr:DUF1642 domain-containing protein [Streptococcus suis]
MNKQQAIKQVEELYGYGSIAKTVTDIISQIHEPQKVVVSKFVATWIERCKQNNLDLDHAMRCTRVNNAETGVEEWIYENQETFARAWLDGYEIEQEALYTVELPNPNKIGNEVNVLMMNGFRQVVLKKEYGNDWKKEKGFQLTEEEIKKDFEWAWQWAEPVEVE